MRISIPYSEFLLLTPRQIQRLSFAVSKADYIQQGGDIAKFKDPINFTEESMQKKSDEANELLDFFESNKDGFVKDIVKSK